MNQRQLAGQQSDAFATLPNSQAAFEYAQSLAKAAGMDAATMTTAIMVYHNTLIQQLKQYCPTGDGEDHNE
jgi:hypothetical protein